MKGEGKLDVVVLNFTGRVQFQRSIRVPLFSLNDEFFLRLIDSSKREAKCFYFCSTIPIQLHTCNVMHKKVREKKSVSKEAGSAKSYSVRKSALCVSTTTSSTQ